ncbi:hypothetical protein [Chitinophaga japonensis]|uniref:Uncharacterized protein n=1 Tax=Chitinophaga japonensis TaxID=104662 RepID=A0A562STD8_CHIJA|nr:hypothetical protein [Chitinophaga japonensis]TWI84403.1 hypothetical protein LX66_4770 [Chitinophaga japonensis]
MKPIRPFLFLLALATGIMAAVAGARVTPWIYIDPQSDGTYTRIPGASYNLRYCQPHAGTYCFYGTTNGNLPTTLTQQQVDAYVSNGVLSAHYPDRRYEPLIAVE